MGLSGVTGPSGGDLLQIEVGELGGNADGAGTGCPRGSLGLRPSLTHHMLCDRVLLLRFSPGLPDGDSRGSKAGGIQNTVGEPEHCLENQIPRTIVPAWEASCLEPAAALGCVQGGEARGKAHVLFCAPVPCMWSHSPGRPRRQPASSSEGRNV